MASLKLHVTTSWQNSNLAGTIPPSYRKLVIGAAIFSILLYPFHKVLPGLGNFSFSDPIIFLLFLVLVPFILSNFKDEILVILLLVLFINITSASFNYVMNNEWFIVSYSLIYILKLLSTFIWFYVVRSIIRLIEMRSIILILYVFVFICIIFSILAIYESLSGTARPTGPFNDPNIFGNYLALGMGVVFAWDSAIKRKSLINTFARLILAITILLALVSTASRSAFVALLTVSLYSIIPVIIKYVDVKNGSISYRIISRLIISPMVFIVLCLLLLTFLQSIPFIQTRLGGLFSAETLESADRWTIWKAALAAWFERPLLGIGPGQTENYLSIVREQSPRIAHNSVLAWLAETGIVGCIAWIIFCAKLFIMGSIVASRYPFARYLVLFFVFTIVQGMFLNVFNFRSLWIVFGIIAGMWDRDRKVFEPAQQNSLQSANQTTDMDFT